MDRATYIESYQPANHLRSAAANGDHALFAQPGEPFELHFTLGINEDWNPDETPITLKIWVLQDYSPVEARFELFNGDRSKVKAKTTGKHAEFDLQHHVTPTTITVPASAFDERRLYRMNIVVAEWHEGIQQATFSKHYSLFYGGYDRPGHPCAPEPKRGKPNDFETKLLQDVFRDVGIIFPASLDSPSGFREFPKPWPVKPGRRVRINLSVLNHWYTRKEHFPTLLLPVFRDRFTGEKFRVRRVYEPENKNYTPREPAVSGRRQFTIQMPEKPGTYDLFVLGWPYAYRVWVNRFGKYNHDRRLDGLPAKTTNFLRFRVQKSGE